jgi:hypothetical protein
MIIKMHVDLENTTTSNIKIANTLALVHVNIFFTIKAKIFWKMLQKLKAAFPQILIKNVQGCLDMKLYVTLTNEWLALSIPDEGYSRNVSCKLNFISMF